ncbi:RNA polymerase subunit sigma-24 [Variovorax paradoxus]|uniref:sigma-70 family RNA polymerase sigma factor n=1 Tax=Variovorax TaxID=34072 RepID=UPI0006E6501C|nr:RNA polymerase subunit sigma-24 [Variovorax paradoxus]KPV04752.1 RNA polymerase subunit sigma-24 [Variovorax paradoxus]KPV05834.1 RNA polymerase subunit sigma-24 [Variovorax paradoxus]KPV09366.1 RNA polymerase subunit sigma-24 [Variovorax paradoxus]KPV28450.1 RNA polymerase subunit sigma-24 [Variovorax paradoxus]
MTDRTRQFEAAALPHLDAAWNLARWLLRDDRLAEDAVQEAYLRAFRFFDGLRGENARPWLLGIVRNACYDWMRQNRQLADQVEFDELRDSESADATAPEAGDPARLWERRVQGERVNAAIDALPAVYREAIVLRELEELRYEDIARIAGVPLGTVMSRLSRARALLRESLRDERPGPTRERTRHANS